MVLEFVLYLHIIEYILIFFRKDLQIQGLAFPVKFGRLDVYE